MQEETVPRAYKFTTPEKREVVLRHQMEFDRRSQLNDRENALVIIVMAFIGAISYYFLNFPKLEWSCGFCLFVMGFATLSFATCVAVGCILWKGKGSNHPNPSSPLRKTSRLKRAFVFLLVFASSVLPKRFFQRTADIKPHEDYAEIRKKRMATDHVRKWGVEGMDQLIHERYLHDAYRNAAQNNSHEARIELAKHWMIVALMGLIIAATVHRWIYNSGEKPNADLTTANHVNRQERR